MGTAHFRSNLHHVCSRSKFGKPHNIKVFGSKNKGSKKDYKNWLKPPMPEERNPNFNK